MESPEKNRKSLLHILVVTGLILSSAAHAYEFERASANMAQEVITCATYFTYWSKANKRDGLDSANFDTSANSALTLAQIYLPEVKKLEAMSALSARLINKVVKEEGATRLVLTYADFCKSMLEHPTDRMQYWLDKR